MRNRPRAIQPRTRRALDLATPRQPPPPQTPQSQGDALISFLNQGGMPFFYDGWGVTPPRTEGVQLLAAQYVPRGFTAWIKRLAVAPYMPPALFDPWAGWPANFEAFEPLPVLNLPFDRASARAGLWRTPFGWESYIDTGTEIRPSWRWALTMIPGDLAAYRARLQIPTFSITDPTSWPFTLDIPVPAQTYPTGIPGRAVPGYLAHQRAQVLPEDSFTTHIQIPEDNTVLLWAYWQQSTVSLRTFAPSGIAQVFPDLTVNPLGPSFGMMHGYMQATDRSSALHNAAFGWQG